MFEYINECVGCPPEIGCIGKACPYVNVPHYFCDICKCEYEQIELFEYDGDMLCSDCLFDNFEHIDSNVETKCDDCGGGIYGDEVAIIGDLKLCKYCLTKNL